MKTKTLKFNDCVVANHKISDHEIVVINDIPLSGKLVRLFASTLDFDTPDRVAFRLLSFPIDAVVTHLDATPGELIPDEWVMPLITIRNTAEMAIQLGKLESRQPVEIEEP